MVKPQKPHTHTSLKSIQKPQSQAGKQKKHKKSPPKQREIHGKLHTIDMQKNIGEIVLHK